MVTPELISDDRPPSVRVDYGMHPNLRCGSDSGAPVSSLDEALMFARVQMDRSERGQTREAGAGRMAERFEANVCNSIELSYVGSQDAPWATDREGTGNTPLPSTGVDYGERNMMPNIAPKSRAA